MSENPKIKAAVRQVVSMLVQKDYETLERLTNCVRMTSTEMAEGVREYGESLIEPPDDAFENLDVVEVEGVQPSEWGVRVDLWTAEEGRSDLTLKLTLRESEKEIFDVEIDNIHVL